jgi:hypothetical protein
MNICHRVILHFKAKNTHKECESATLVCMLCSIQTTDARSIAADLFSQIALNLVLQPSNKLIGHKMQMDT